jgi:nuclease HARBI1
MDSESGVSSSDDDMLEFLGYLAPHRRNEREDTNFMELYNNSEFIKRYRLTKQTVEYLCDRLDAALYQNSVNALSVQEQVLHSLRYYATGTFQSAVADMSGRVHQTTVGKNMHRVSAAICNLRQQYITFPATHEEQDNIVQEFYNIARMPNVLGTIDCTHIRVISQGGDYGELFRNRKGYFSLNVQTISDPKLKIRDIVSRWYGSSHDSTIWSQSYRHNQFLLGMYRHYVLLGDGGYACSPFMLTPVPNPINQADRAYNRSQISTRNTVERQYGVWKRRFPCLDLGIRSPYLQRIQNIITATAILHNVALDQRNPEPPNEPQVRMRVEEARRQFPAVPVQHARPGGGGNTDIRDRTILHHFSN